MKTYNISKIGTAALAVVSVLGIEACAHHRGHISTPVPAVQRVSAPASLAGKTLFLTGSNGEKTTIRFAENGVTKFKFRQQTHTAEYYLIKDEFGKAQVAVRPDGGSDSGWHYVHLKFNQEHSGTYQLLAETCTDGSEPDLLVGSGTFTVQ